jgi:hypothetical protein
VTQIPLVSFCLQRTLFSVAMLCGTMSKSNSAYSTGTTFIHHVLGNIGWLHGKNWGRALLYSKSKYLIDSNSHPPQLINYKCYGTVRML